MTRQTFMGNITINTLIIMFISVTVTHKVFILILISWAISDIRAKDVFTILIYLYDSCGILSNNFDPSKVLSLLANILNFHTYPTPLSSSSFQPSNEPSFIYLAPMLTV